LEGSDNKKGDNSQNIFLSAATLLKGKNSNDKWHEGILGSNLDSAQLALSSDPKAIANYFEDNGITAGDYYRHICIPGLHMDLLYAKAKQGEFFIPLLHARDELYGLKNMAAYSRGEIVDAIGGSLYLSDKRPNTIPKSGGPATGLDESQGLSAAGAQGFDKRLAVLASVLALLAAFAGIYVYRSKQTNS
jgi:hypothetical protein